MTKATPMEAQAINRYAARLPRLVIAIGDDLELEARPDAHGKNDFMFIGADGTGSVVEFTGRRVLSTQVCPDPSAHVKRPMRRHWAIRLVRRLAGR